MGIFSVIFTVDFAFLSPIYASYPDMEGLLAKAAFWSLIIVIYAKEVPLTKRVAGWTMAWIIGIALKITFILSTQGHRSIFSPLHSSSSTLLAVTTIGFLIDIAPAWLLHRYLQKTEFHPIKAPYEEEECPNKDLPPFTDLYEGDIAQCGLEDLKKYTQGINLYIDAFHEKAKKASGEFLLSTVDEVCSEAKRAIYRKEEDIKIAMKKSEPPKKIALIIVKEVTSDKILSNRFRVHRGVLDVHSLSLKKIYLITSSVMHQKGYCTQDEVKANETWLDKAIDAKIV